MSATVRAIGAAVPPSAAAGSAVEGHAASQFREWLREEPWI